jgi:hypothetical protein
MMTPHCYLNGIDYVTRALGYTCRLTPGKNNHFLVVLELNEPIDAEALSFDLSPYLALLHGRVRRNFLLAPYWQPGAAREITVNTEFSDLETYANLPLSGGAQLNIAIIEKQLVFKLGHQLFDGRGAEMFIRMLFSKQRSTAEIGLKSADLLEWRSKFTAGKTINRYLISLRQQEKNATLATPTAQSSGNHLYKLNLDNADTALIRQRAEQAAGPFMLGCYLTAMTARCVAKLQQTRQLAGAVMLPVSIDLRGVSVPPEIVFFNQWSVSPVYLTLAADTAPRQWLDAAKRQLIANTANRLPQALRLANMLTRIVPLRLMPLLLSSLSGSAMFAFLPDSLITQDMLPMRITNLYHWPLMPPAPGLGIFINIFDDKMNVVFSWRDGVISQTEAQNAALALREALLNGV